MPFSLLSRPGLEQGARFILLLLLLLPVIYPHGEHRLRMADPQPAAGTSARRIATTTTTTTTTRPPHRRTGSVHSTASSFATPALTLPKSASSAAISTTDADIDVVRASGSLAADSLRRVASSATLSRARSRTESNVSRTSVVSAASSSYRNPAALLVQQRAPSQSFSPVDPTNVGATLADANPNLTAESLARTARRSSLVPTSTAAGPSRSSSVSSRTSSRSERRVTFPDSPVQDLPSPRPRQRPAEAPRRRPRSFISSQPPSSATETTIRHLGPRPSTLFVPTEPDIEASTIIMAKRALEELDGSTLPASAQNGASTQPASTESHSPTQKRRAPSSRRKTWFGSSSAELNPPPEDPDRRRTITQRDVSQAVPPLPPPMNDDEAAFRAALGFPVAEEFQSQPSLPPSASTDPRQSSSAASLRAGRSPNADRIARAARRITWFGWRAQDDSAGDDTFNLPKDEGPVPSSSSERHSQPAEDAPKATEVSIATTYANGGTGPESGAGAPPGNGAGDGGARKATVKKRGWLGKEYEVEVELEKESPSTAGPMLPEPMELDGDGADKGGDTIKARKSVAVQDSSDTVRGPQPPAQSSFSLRNFWSRGGPPSNLEQAPVMSAPVKGTPEPDATAQRSESQDPPTIAYPPPPPQPVSDSNGQQKVSEPWQWPTWRGNGRAQVPSEDPVAVTKSMPPPDSVSVQTAQAVAIDAGGKVGEKEQTGPPSFADSSTSWTYSSYLARWVPTWAYRAQQQEQEQEQEQNAQEPGTDMPKTPAEQVKADALARPDPAASPAAIASAAVDPNRAVLNKATKSGWIRYFASRSANLPKNMAEPVTDDDGMEVMYLGAAPESSSASKPQPQPARAIPTIKTSAQLTSSAIKQGVPSTPTSRAPSTRTPANGSKAGSIASVEASPVGTSLSTSKDKDGGKNLTKAVLAKAANASAAVAAGVGAAKRSENVDGQGSTAASAVPVSKTGDDGVPPPTTAPAAMNLVLPTFDDTFGRPPRSWPPKVGVLERTLSAVNSYLFSKVPDVERMRRPTRFSSYGEPGELVRKRDSQQHRLSADNASVPPSTGSARGQHLAGKAKATGRGSSKDKDKEEALKEVANEAQRLPRSWWTLGHQERAASRGCAGIGKIVVIGVHGWFVQSIFKSVIGEPTGTSHKFATMQTESIRRHFKDAGMELNPEAITVISLQGDGKVADRVDRLFAEVLRRKEWVEDLAAADAIFLSAHSQGAIVATQLLARLIEQGQVSASRSRICLLSMAGIHHGPFAHLKSTIMSSYINYFETAAAKELFEFQSSDTAASVHYREALRIILDAGVKCVYVGSTDDNVVPLYSALNSSNRHPSILRALYIDGQAFPRVDFLTNLLVLCVAVRNAGLSDHKLLTLLSASVAGSLYGGRGHSNVYEEGAVYDLATRYLFEVSHPLSEPTQVPGHAAPRAEGGGSSRPELESEPFEAQRWNPYELPWSLRGLFEDKQVRSLFAEDMLGLLEDYDEWRPDPKSKSLKDLQWRLAPMRGIARPKVEGGSVSRDEAGTGTASTSGNNVSKL